MTPPEYPPFTADQKRALRECRHVTTNMAHSWMLAYTADKAVADAVGLGCTPIHWEEYSHPERIQYEIQSAHPDAISTAEAIMQERAGAAHV